jgi:LAO/AO transport system kinase
MSDAFLVLMPPAGGDELQGIKKGIMEYVDFVVINKADGELKSIAKRAAVEYSNALRLLRPKSDKWTPKVSVCSALEGDGIVDLWKKMQEYRQVMTVS